MPDPIHDPGPEAALARLAELGDAPAEPIPAGKRGRILVGTASWTDRTMTAPGVFYPQGVDSAEERLRYYATQFPLVEVDSTYYAIPEGKMAALWLRRTPPEFTFDVKAYALMTGQPSEVKRLPHEVREELPDKLSAKARLYARDLPAELYDQVWSLFRQALLPLHSAGKLGSVLLQYPRWFFPSHENREVILDARRRLGDMPCAVELRSGSWFNARNLERTLAFLEQHDLPFVMVDAPQGLKSSPPQVVAVTSPELALVRFHGRRAETWEARGVLPVERFRYLYDRDELAEWVPRIEEAAGRARETHVLMNNCYSNYAAVNAKEIAQLLASS